MKPLLLAIALAVAPALPFAVRAHEPAPPAASEVVPPATAAAAAATAPAIAVVESFSIALKAGDFSKAGALLADDVLILESGGAEHSRQEYLSGHAKHDAAFLKDAQIAIKQRVARIEGDLAWVGTESELRMTTLPGTTVTLMSTETMVLRRMRDGWRIVHIHWSSSPKR